MKLGAFMRSLRKAAGLSHQELADKAGLNRNTLTNLEGEESIRFDTLRQILNSLEVSPSDWGLAANLWIRQQIGEADYMRFCVADNAKQLLVAEQESLFGDARELSKKLARIAPEVRTELIKAAGRPEVVESIKLLNQYHEKVVARVTTERRKTRVLRYSDEPDAPSPRVAEGSTGRGTRKRTRKREKK